MLLDGLHYCRVTSIITIYDFLIFSLSECVGFVDNVSEIQNSERSGNPYFDIQIRTSENEANRVRIMMKSNPGIKRQLFVDKKSNSQQIRMTNLSQGNSGIAFFSIFQESNLEEAANLVDFKPAQQKTVEIDEIQLHSQGTTFTVKGALKWIGETKAMKSRKVKANSNEDTEEALGKAVRDAVIADKNGNILLSMWEDLVELQDDQWYAISHVTTKQYNGLKLNTTRYSNTEDFESEEIIDWHTIPVEEYMNDTTQHSAKKAMVACCPDVNTVLINTYPVCISSKCGRKVNIVPGEKLVQCIWCSKRMLVAKCPLQLNCHIAISVDGRDRTLTIFAKELEEFLHKDILQEYSSTLNKLEIKLLEMENIDITNNSKNIVILIEKHKHSS